MFKIAFVMLISMPLALQGQQVLALYEDEVPNSISASTTENADLGDDGILRVSHVSVPTLTVYRPAAGVTSSGKAVIICPGGGYGILAMSHEGHDVALALAEAGITAFVLKYRLPSGAIMQDKAIGPLQDAQRAIQLIRERAGEWGINPNHIGIAGFSAGGHLAASLSTHYHEALIENPNGTSLRPDFSLLVYPVISMEEGLTHGGSRNNLLGDSPTVAQVIRFSNEQRVTPDTPPAFLVHAEDDLAVPITNSQAYARALEAHGINAKLLVYPKGGHGFGLVNRSTDDRWFDHFLSWLDSL